MRPPIACLWIMGKRADTSKRALLQTLELMQPPASILVCWRQHVRIGKNGGTLNPKNTGLGGALAGVGLEARTRPRKRAAPQHRSVRGVAQQRDNNDTLNPKP